MAALLLGGELVFEMDRSGPGLDIGLHDLEAVQWPAEPGLGIGDDRHEPVALCPAFADLDLVGALEGAIDPPRQLGPGIGGIERLVGVHRAGGVGVGRDLPAREVDCVEPGADLLHCLVASHSTKGPHWFVALQHLPQPIRPAAGQSLFDDHRSAQRLNFRRAIAASYSVEPTGGGGNQLVKTCHGQSFKQFRCVSQCSKHPKRSHRTGKNGLAVTN